MVILVRVWLIVCLRSCCNCFLLWCLVFCMISCFFEINCWVNVISLLWFCVLLMVEYRLWIKLLMFVNLWCWLVICDFCVVCLWVIWDVFGCVDNLVVKWFGVNFKLMSFEMCKWINCVVRFLWVVLICCVFLIWLVFRLRCVDWNNFWKGIEVG